MSKLARSNLSQRKTRTALSILAVAVELALVLVLVGLTKGTLGEYANRIENVQADLLLMPPGSQLFVGLNSAVMPAGAVARTLSEVEAVRDAAPVVIANTTKFGGVGMVWGVELESYNRVGRGITIKSGRGFDGSRPSPRELIVDVRLARAQGLKLGDEVELLNESFEVVGICEEGSGVRLYVPIATAQDLLGRIGKASLFFVSVTNPELATQARAQLLEHPAFKTYTVVEMRRYAEMLGSSAPGINEFIAAVTGVAVLFGFLVISLSLYTTIIERTRQIGVLKSLGASQLFIVRTVVEECLWLCLLGILVGFAITWLVKTTLVTLHPTLTVEITSVWVVRASLLAIVGGLLGALYPAWRAARVDPVKALQYE